MTTYMTLRTTLFSTMLATAPAFLSAQGLPGSNIVYQQAGALTGAMPVTGDFGFVAASPLGPTVTGKPFSATEQRRSLQVLGDGTRIERTDEDRYYRDSEGRTRIEQKSGDTVIATIHDPVAGFMITMNSGDKTAHKMPAPGVAQAVASSAPFGVATPGIALSSAPAGGEKRIERRIEIRGATEPMEFNLPVPPPPGGATGQIAGVANVMILRQESTQAMPAAEDLGTQFLNGVSVQGSRNTLTIPAGQIGNDREIRVVSERWYSPDLQMTVKSSNNDPRFGESTFELININRAAPDPALFSVPADYSVVQPKIMEFRSGGAVK